MRTRPYAWPERTSGRERYAGDLRFDGLLVGRIVRSPHPLARVVSVDVRPALQMPGVHAALTAADFPSGVRYLHQGVGYADRPPLAVDLVRHVGQEVAAVAAESEEAADAAARVVRVRYRPMRAPTSFDAARTHGAIALHERGTGEVNVAARLTGSWGDPEAGRRASAVVVEGTFVYTRVSHVCMEPNTTVARWDTNREVLELWTSTQAPYFVRKEVAHALGLAKEQVICRDVAVGGGFGSKSKISEHEVLAAALSMASGRPVRIAYSREEEFATTKPRHGFRTSLRTGADGDGRLRLLEAEIEVDNGSYNHYGPSVMKVGIKTLGSLYEPDGVSWDARLIDTALPPGGQFRGFGRPQASLAMESQVDEIAEKLGIDPLELRRRNANPPNSVTANGSRIGSARLVECLDAVREAIGWDNKRANPRPGKGVGVAAGTHGSGSYTFPDSNWSEAGVDVFEDGKVRVRFGGADPGTGQRTILAQICAEELGVAVEDVEVLTMDSAQTPHDMGAWSSRGTHMGGHAVRRAAQDMASRLERLGAEKLGTDDIRLDGGYVHSPVGDAAIGDLAAIDPDARNGAISLHARYTDERMEMFSEENPNANVSASCTFAAHACEVEVDRRTGEVCVLDYVAAHDVGRAINPAQTEGQIIGGVVMGLGAALGEELIHEAGRTVNPTYLNYALPRAADVPRVRPILIEGEEHAGPYNAKSVGEISILPSGAAVANAVYDAIGIRFRELPITPDKVLRALAEKEGRRAIRVPLWRRPGRWWIAAMRWLYPRGLHTILHRWGTRLAHRKEPRPVVEVVQPTALSDAVEELGRDSAPLAGGTDLLVRCRQRLANPTRLVSLMSIPELLLIKDRPEGLEIGAGVSLAEAAAHLRGRIPTIAEAIETVASPQIRAMATVAGNLLQEKRCWFFRNGFDCYKRGGPTCPCYAVLGDHRFHHAAMGAHRCQAVTPSDLATVLLAYDATATLVGRDETRTVPVAELYTGPGETICGHEELVRNVTIPAQAVDRHSAFEKLRLWEGDFAIVSVALSTVPSADGSWNDPRIVLGAVAPTPWRARRTEAGLDGGSIDPDRLADALTDELNEVADPLRGNAWKLDAVKGLAQRATETIIGAEESELPM